MINKLREAKSDASSNGLECASDRSDGGAPKFEKSDDDSAALE